MTAPAASLPLPLPADVDLSGMDYIPLRTDVLMTSRAWRRARNWRGEGPGLGFVLLNLWMGAFATMPAGSIEDDDDELCDRARCDIDHWQAMKARALEGWLLIDGRWHHPYVSQVAWDLWLKRLEVRHEKTHDSQRAAAKRAMDRGREPPPPVPHFQAWLAATYPATAAYLAGLSGANGDLSGGRPADFADCPADKSKSPADFEPKVREGKGIPPVVPPTQPVDRPDGQGTGKAGRDWFAGEVRRLGREFGPLLDTLSMNLQRRSCDDGRAISARYTLVDALKGAFKGADGAVVLPSKQRADAFIAAHHPWLNHYAIKVRWATVDEKRAFKREAAA